MFISWRQQQRSCCGVLSGSRLCVRGSCSWRCSCSDGSRHCRCRCSDPRAAVYALLSCCCQTCCCHSTRGVPRHADFHPISAAAHAEHWQTALRQALTRRGGHARHDTAQGLSAPRLARPPPGVKAGSRPARKHRLGAVGEGSSGEGGCEGEGMGLAGGWRALASMERRRGWGHGGIGASRTGQWSRLFLL